MPPNAAHLCGAAYLQLSTEGNYTAARKRQFGICQFDVAAVNTAELALRADSGSWHLDFRLPQATYVIISVAQLRARLLPAE